MSESRLSALALMKINRDRCTKLVSEENIKMVKSFMQLHPRRTRLSFMLQDDYYSYIVSLLIHNLLITVPQTSGYIGSYNIIA